MMHDIEAIYDAGVFRPIEPVFLKNGVRVHLRVEEDRGAEESRQGPGRIESPRLAHPEQAIEFEMEVREIPDAGV